MGSISLLDPRLASRIAAGEVIERPQSIARELLDNALDAGADEIRVEIEGGGIDRLSVIDNGKGIAREDLEILGARHATSKLHSENDLYDIKTLGFRGEAIYSISAVSRFSIKTTSAETGESSTLVIDNGRREPIQSYGPDKGTIATAENLFGEIPARRYFLKRASTEGSLIRNLIVSKALAFPSVRFTLVVDGAIRLDWPRSGRQKERCMLLYRTLGIPDADVNDLTYQGDDFSISVIAGNSSVKRSDRKEIRIYVNKRPVEDYALMQAVIYGYGELLPGGSFPCASVFIEDNPEMVDFNIHPTKKEVKLRNAAEVHHGIVSAIKSGIERKIPEAAPVQKEFYLEDTKRTEYTVQPSHQPSHRKEFQAERTMAFKPKDSSWLEKAKALKSEREKSIVPQQEASPAEEEKETVEFRYIGQAFKLFLIVEKGDELLFIDQHAAHERILYNELIQQIDVQKLLIPIELDTDQATSEFLDDHSHVYTKLGIMLSKTDDGRWEITALPAACRPIETEIVDFIESARMDEEELESKLFAVIACRAAIKAGDDIDRWSAEELIRKVFELPEPACPHGRTFVSVMKEKNLRLLSGRTE